MRGVWVCGAMQAVRLFLNPLELDPGPAPPPGMREAEAPASFPHRIIPPWKTFPVAHQTLTLQTSPFVRASSPVPPTPHGSRRVSGPLMRGTWIMVEAVELLKQEYIQALGPRGQAPDFSVPFPNGFEMAGAMVHGTSGTYGCHERGLLVSVAAVIHTVTVQAFTAKSR